MTYYTISTISPIKKRRVYLCADWARTGYTWTEDVRNLSTKRLFLTYKNARKLFNYLAVQGDIAAANAHGLRTEKFYRND